MDHLEVFDQILIVSTLIETQLGICFLTIQFESVRVFGLYNSVKILLILSIYSSNLGQSKLDLILQQCACRLQKIFFGVYIRIFKVIIECYDNVFSILLEIIISHYLSLFLEFEQVKHFLCLVTHLFISMQSRLYL